MLHPPPVAVIVERDAVIAEDLRQGVAALGPCRQRVFPTLAELEAALPRIGRIVAAVVESGAEELSESGLATALLSRGARIVLTAGPSGAAEAHGWAHLQRPFTDCMLRAALPCAEEAAGPVSDG